MSKQELSEAMKKAIDEYGKDIQTLEDYVTAVRKIPGMYIGPINEAGLLNMIREIFQNAVDQILDPSSPGNYVYLYYNMQTLEVIVEDNGRGLPFDSMIRILTTPHTSKNYEKKAGEYSSGRHGQGAKVVNALSLVLVGESYRYDGTAVRLETKKGYPTTKEPKPIKNKDNKQGTRISFIPDSDVMGDMNLEWQEVYRLTKHIMSLTPIGSRMDFEAIDINGKRFTETVINKDGIITDLIMKVKRPIIKPIVIGNDDGIRKLECAFCYDAGDEKNGPDDKENVTSFSNLCPTVAGTHIDGTVEGICRWFTNYMNNIYLINQKSKTKLKIINNDIKSGLNIMISAAHIEPNFTGQAKEILSNQDMQGFCKEVVMKGLDEWSKANPQDLAKISRFFKDIAELRQKAESGKAKIVTKYQANVITGLPSKYIRPMGKENIELIIVEGDSALGTVQTGRDSKTQGIFPIRGKIINAFKNSKQAFFSNEEVQGITKIILGSDYKKGFDVKDCKVSKVIFMADADVDRQNCPKMLFV